MQDLQHSEGILPPSLLLLLLVITCCVAHLLQHAADQLQQSSHLPSPSLINIKLPTHSHSQLICSIKQQVEDKHAHKLRL
jgi:hypothetical protein